MIVLYMKGKLQFEIKNLIAPLVIISFAVALRIMPHPANVAPISAMALFGGIYLNKKYALIIPLIALFISDIFLGFHDTMFFVYSSFLISGFIGLWMRNNKTTFKVIAGTFISSLIFFLITNFGVWLVSDMYSKTLSGLAQSYIMGIPFYRNTLIGDFLYTGIFFITYEISVRLLNSSVKYFYLLKK